MDIEYAAAPEAPEVIPPGIQWGRVEVDGGRVLHGHGGSGPLVVFLHGWAAGPHVYRDPILQLLPLGCRVVAPALPGFAGTAALRGEECSFEGYARWIVRYLDSVGIEEPVMMLGHSFGGGVGIQMAHDFPDWVRGVLICNSVGGPATWSSAGDSDGGVPQPPPRGWRRRMISGELFGLPAMAKVVPGFLEDAVPNVIHNPLALWRVADFIRRSSLMQAAKVIADRRVSVTVVSSDRDRLVPHDSFSALCKAFGVDGVVTRGYHNWLLSQPEDFSDIALRALADAGVMDDIIAAKQQAKSAQAAAVGDISTGMTALTGM